MPLQRRTDFVYEVNLRTRLIFFFCPVNDDIVMYILGRCPPFMQIVIFGLNRLITGKL